MVGEGKPKAVIVGGSIAGISSAHALQLAGWDVVILEKTSAPPTASSTGAGLGLDPLSLRILHSWLPHPELLRNTTVPLNIVQVPQSYDFVCHSPIYILQNHGSNS